MLAMLLAFAIGFSCIGCTAWFSAQSQISSIAAEYTTIAVPLPQNYNFISQQWMNIGGLAKDDGNIYWSDGTITYSKENIATIAKQAPQGM